MDMYIFMKQTHYSVCEPDHGNYQRLSKKRSNRNSVKRLRTIQAFQKNY